MNSRAAYGVSLPAASAPVPASSGPVWGPTPARGLLFGSVYPPASHVPGARTLLQTWGHKAGWGDGERHPSSPLGPRCFPGCHQPGTTAPLAAPSCAAQPAAAAIPGRAGGWRGGCRKAPPIPLGTRGYREAAWAPVFSPAESSAVDGAGVCAHGLRVA